MKELQEVISIDTKYEKKTASELLGYSLQQTHRCLFWGFLKKTCPLPSQCSPAPLPPEDPASQEVEPWLGQGQGWPRSVRDELGPHPPPGPRAKADRPGQRSSAMQAPQGDAPTPEQWLLPWLTCPLGDLSVNSVPHVSTDSDSRGDDLPLGVRLHGWFWWPFPPPSPC